LIRTIYKFIKKIVYSQVQFFNFSFKLKFPFARFLMLVDLRMIPER